MALLAGFNVAAAADEASAEVIAHPSVNAEFLNRSYLRSVFTLRMRAWPDGKPVHIFVFNDGDAVHTAFCREVLGTFPYILRRTWDRTLFTGTGLVPVEVDSIEEMRRRVFSTPGAIGYVPTEVTGLLGAEPARLLQAVEK